MGGGALMPNSNQLKLIHVARRELGLDRDEYEDLLEANFGVRSSRSLDVQDAARLIKVFERMGFKVKPGGKKPVADKKQPPSDPKGLITKDQQKVIAGLADMFAWNSESLKKVSQRIIKKSWAQTHAEGQKIIYAMVSMNADEIATTVWNLRSADLTEWERYFLFGHETCAEKELQRFIEANKKRGHRTMPKIALTKLIEIYKSRGKTYSPPGSIH